MERDASFRLIGGYAAYLVAAFSILYAIVYLGFVRSDGGNETASATAWLLSTAGSLAAAIATAALASYIAGAAGVFLAALGVAYSVLAATHGAFSAISDIQGYAGLDLSPIDPRGFVTFGLAGLWSVFAGLELRARPGLRPIYWQLAVAGGIDLILLFIATAIGSTTLILVTGGLASAILGPVFWAMTGRLLTAER